jgi:hypothetical protein
VYLELGRYGAAVDPQIAAVEAALDAEWTAAVGDLWATGPAGIERTDEIAWDPAGYDPATGAIHVDADSGAAVLEVTAAGLVAPIVVVHGATVTEVLLDGVRLSPDAGVYLSQDGDDAWITIPRTLDGTHTVEMR